MHGYVIIGGGIVGLATAMAMGKKFPKQRFLGNMVELIKSVDGTLQTGTRVDCLRHVNGTHVIETSRGEFEARFSINCAGLFSDRVAILVASSILADQSFLNTTWRRLALIAIIIPLGTTKRVPHFRDRSSLCACGPADDS